MPVEPTYRLYTCVRCAHLTRICPRCDRGQRYCSRGCSAIQRRELQAVAARRYQSSPRGRRAHAARQKLYRERSAKKVTHQGPPTEVQGSTLPCPRLHKEEFTDDPTKKNLETCDFCSRWCEPLARRDFLRQRRRDWLRIYQRF